MNQYSSVCTYCTLFVEGKNEAGHEKKRRIFGVVCAISSSTTKISPVHLHDTVYSRGQQETQYAKGSNADMRGQRDPLAADQ